MDNFNSIIKHLGVSCVVFIENDFSELQKTSEIVSKYILLSDINKQALCRKLKKNGYNSLVQNLGEFDASICSLNPTEKDKGYFSTGEIDYYLKRTSIKEVLLPQFEQVKNLIDEDEEIRKIFFRYGLINPIPLSPYNSFLPQMVNEQDYNVLCFDDLVANQIEELETDLKDVLDENQSFVVIIDNKLGSGESAGVKIAKEFVKGIIEKNNLTGYSVIFTSQTPLPHDNKVFGDEYYQVVKKTDNSLYDISKALSLIAFTKTFTYLQEKTKHALDKASGAIMEQRNNIAYIVDKANAEGMLPYQAIQIWYENAINYYLNEAFIEEKPAFTKTIGLTKLFDKNFLEGDTKLSLDFEKICTNEIFDYSVNSKHLPIAPGDVFLLAPKSYFVLVGQSCDLTVRSKTTKRTAAIAELLGSSFRTKTKLKNEYKKLAKLEKIKEKDIENWVNNNLNKKINRKEASLVFKGFNNSTECGYLEVRYKTSDLLLLDFSILDLCMYNKEGLCMIDITKDLHKSFDGYLAKAYRDKYSLLQKQIEEIIQLKDSGLVEVERLKCLFTYEKKDNTIIYPYQRICRIKGNFKNLIHHNYWHYRSRIDLNEINLGEDESN